MNKQTASAEQIAHVIYFIRGQKVLLDHDLAALYGVATRVLNQAVKRNKQRFPPDFMFRLNVAEYNFLRSQFVTSSVPPLIFQFGISSWGGRRHLPFAFTEQGVAMLSSVLNSERAIKVNIAIMRAFVKLREALETNKKLARKFAELEKHVGKHDDEISAIIEAIRQLMAPPIKPRREIGFHVRETEPRYRVRRRR